MAVQFQAEVAEAYPVQAAFHHFEGGHLFTDEQDIFACGEQFGDDIGDGLRFTRARRPLNYQTFADFDILDNSDL